MSLIQKLTDRRSSLVAHQDGLARQIAQLENEHRGLAVAIEQLDFAIEAATAEGADAIAERAPERQRRNIRAELLAIVQSAADAGITVSAAKTGLHRAGPVRDRAVTTAVEKLVNKGQILKSAHDTRLGDILFDPARVAIKTVENLAGADGSFGRAAE